MIYVTTWYYEILKDSYWLEIYQIIKVGLDPKITLILHDSYGRKQKGSNFSSVTVKDD